MLMAITVTYEQFLVSQCNFLRKIFALTMPHSIKLDFAETLRKQT